MKKRFFVGVNLCVHPGTLKGRCNRGADTQVCPYGGDIKTDRRGELWFAQGYRSRAISIGIMELRHG